MRTRAVALAAAMAVLGGCDHGLPSSPPPPRVASQALPGPAGAGPVTAGRFDDLRQAILEARATPAEVREALGDPDPMGLANTLNALYLMGNRDWVLALLHSLWRGEHGGDSDLDWDRLRQPSARVAVAHTLARLDAGTRQDCLRYIRKMLNYPEDLVQAEAAIALGFVGTDGDVPRLRELGASGRAYAAESAIKALAIRGSEEARRALLTLKAQFAADRRRSKAIRQALVEGFPEEEPGAGRGQLIR